MQILNPQSGPGGIGAGQDWSGSRPRSGLIHGFCYNMCSAISSCFYVFCCCWLIEDCFVGRRSFPGPPYGSPGPPPPPPPHVGPGPHGIMGPLLGHTGPPGPIGYSEEPGRHGIMGSLFGQPGPPGPPGPSGYPGEPAPF
ncbi:hypothetical protein PHJA_000333400 [Phtheirospermum japonicum]|uniref:Uncharacterized protein n=1 Tax=Phtheirospermum japonicum TaxID=374723 RepID=A0A830BIK9_9LAMI|nr:hypothetical protein PHJA_000333400 [Phtheirospermum japonicum]